MPWEKNIELLKAMCASLDAVFDAPPECAPVVDVSYVVVAAFDFGRIQNPLFFKALQCMAEKMAANSLLVAALEPSPIDYYYRHFGSVPVFSVDRHMDAEEFLENLSWDPNGGGADSIGSHAIRMVIVDDRTSFVVLGEHGLELARLLVRPDVVGLRLQDCLPLDWRYDRDEIRERLLESGVEAEAATKVSNQLAS